MPRLVPKKTKERTGDDKIYHYGNHKRYSYDHRPGYKKRNNENEGVRAGKLNANPI